MYILHYSLGFPPYRTGGLTKFCIDLMNYQRSINIKVAMLWPGKIDGKKVKIVRSNKSGILSFEIINPLPISLCNGISNHLLYTKNFPIDFFDSFLDKQKPDIIHVHTLEGLPVEFLIAAKKKGIKLIYTTHDFFGICPTNHLFNGEELCDLECFDCSKCNSRAFSVKKIRMMQSPFYRFIKDSFFVKLIRKRYKSKTNYSGEHKNDCDYKFLRNYYMNCFSLFDIIHCNSSVTYNVFSKIFDTDKLVVANITNNATIDNRMKRVNQKKNILTFMFLGPEVKSKGFFFLIDILDDIYKIRKDFKLVIYSKDDVITREYIIKNGPYDYSEISVIYKECDVLLVPSISYETFSFVVYEAYNNGVPSLVTNNVGAKDIINNDITGFISSIFDYKNRLIYLLNNKDLVYETSENIKKIDLNLTFESIQEKIYSRFIK